MRCRFLFLLFVLVAVEATAQPADPNVVVRPERFQTMKYRLVGPARGGRVTAVAGVPGAERTYYFGSTGGGVWKTTDGGTTWDPVTDGALGVGSIGAVAVAPSDPNVVYVGTGSACPRGNVSPGDGVYRSTDGGATWKHIGLRESGQIGKIVVDPRDPDVVFIAALGNVFGKNEQRGVFRSRDGGATWDHILAHSDSVGAVDLDMDPTNPRILFAGLWRIERKPWTLIDGSTEGGVYKSSDGGTTWERLETGLPSGLIGRPGIAVSPAKPNRLWVVLEAAETEKGGLFRSDDGGASFERVSANRELLTRHWYYSHVVADPEDENTVYVLNADFFRSIDGGKTFEEIRVPHGDNHALWINPHDARIMIEGNDGGANVSFNGGSTWSTQLNQPTAEFYRVTVDESFPYRLYGAQQDNTTLSIPSTPPGGLTPQETWFEVGGGESGHIAVDPREPHVVYAGNYIGQISRLDRSRGHIRNVTTYPQMHDGVAPRDIRYRFQWNAPIRISPHDPDVLYHASQFVHRSRDGGQSWEVISPDLTTNNDAYHDIPGGPIQHDHTGVELYTTIFAFEESGLEPGVLWAGSDDGLVHVSRDNGASWTNVTPRNMPREGTVNTIEISRHAPGRVFLSVYRYRENDSRPYVFLTTDYGKSWSLLTDGKNGIPETHFVRVVREDPDRRDLLYAGTEYGMYLSVDGGRHWQSIQLNLPVTPITDLVVHHQDLVVATQGRSFWILDDLTPLHDPALTGADAEFHLLPPRPAFRTQWRGFRGAGAPESAPGPAVLNAWFDTVPDTATTVVRLEILDGEGRSASVWSTRPDKERQEVALPLAEGLNRWEWNLRYPPPRPVEGAIMSLANLNGPQAVPGSYTVVLSVGDTSRTRALEVRIDPRWETTPADLQEQFRLANEIRTHFDEIHQTIRSLRSIREQMDDQSRHAVDGGFPDTLAHAAASLSDSLIAVESDLLQRKNQAGQDPINFPPRLDDQFAYLYTVVNGQDARPTSGSQERLADLLKEWEPLRARAERVLNEGVETFNGLLETHRVPRLVRPAAP